MNLTKRTKLLIGIAAATSGLATAHVIRMTAPFTEELSLRHHHNVEFQLVYVLKDWFKSEFEGQGGVQTMKEGSAGFNHQVFGSVLGWSDDCELLEIILPAEHARVNDP